jgi:hypothetical protein
MADEIEKEQKKQDLSADIDFDRICSVAGTKVVSKAESFDKGQLQTACEKRGLKFTKRLFYRICLLPFKQEDDGKSRNAVKVHLLSLMLPFPEDVDTLKDNLNKVRKLLTGRAIEEVEEIITGNFLEEMSDPNKMEQRKMSSFNPGMVREYLPDEYTGPVDDNPEEFSK